MPEKGRRLLFRSPACWQALSPRFYQSYNSKREHWSELRTEAGMVVVCFTVGGNLQ